MADPKLKLSKVKVLSVTDKSFDGRDGSKVNAWELVLQNEEDTSQVLTGMVYKVLDERVKQGESVSDVWVYEDPKDGKAKFFFPKEGSGGGKGGRTYGKSEAELRLMRQDLYFKIYSTHMSYVKDILLQTTSGDFPWNEWYALCKDGVKQILVDLKEVQG